MVFNINQTNESGISQPNPGTAKYPPKKSVAVIADMSKIFAYSPKKNSAKDIEEYSTKYPATSSDSPSGRSKGVRFVSAKAEIKKTINMGKSGMKNQMFRCASTNPRRLKVLKPSVVKAAATITTVMITSPRETSYDTICAAERNAPKNGYLELDAHPAIIIP